jgi:hypothetical protein
MKLRKANPNLNPAPLPKFFATSIPRMMATTKFTSGIINRINHYHAGQRFSAADRDCRAGLMHPARLAGLHEGFPHTG